MEPVKNDEDWQLSRIDLELNKYGEFAGKYTGTIRFKNGVNESFQFNIRPDLAQPYIDLIAAEIVKAGELLAHRLIESLQLRDR